ncbi:MAG: glycosyl transferase [Candidatus Omnitrophota bacterium]|nr:MAG: glycosyl transferase [Candidatus Omnitrophota bacterium]HDN97546.1 glycosyltransferase [bacterium]
MRTKEKITHFRPTEYSIYKPKICFLSTYPPKPCGIATFTNDLLVNIDEYNPLVSSIAIAINRSDENYDYPEEVVKVIRMEEKEDYRDAAKFINESDVEVVSIQHEFGLFGGNWGENILELMRNLKKPAVTTLHTIIPNPSLEIRKILREICNLSSYVVVMTNIGREILKEFYGISKRKIEMIYHGVPFVYLRPPQFAKEKLNLSPYITLSTFGLLSRGKGLEYVIYALPEILSRYPNVVYLIVGVTHPNVKKYEGEAYREFLKSEAERLGVSEHVKFYNKFLSLEELLEFLEATDIYITPYLNPNQITSGTLSYALGCGKAIISTPFLYAKDVLENGKRGILVNFRSPGEIAESVINLIRDSEKKKQLEREAYKLGQRMIWPQVAWEYLTLFSRTSAGRNEVKRTYFEDRLLPIKLSHLETLTDDVGIIQHAKFSMADRKTGYTLDDNARALVVATKHYNLYQDETSLRLINTYLSFIYYMQKSNGWFHNLLSYERNFLDSECPDDTFGRVIWALGYLLSSEFVNENIKGAAKQIFSDVFKQIKRLSFLRGKALCIQGLFYYHKIKPSDEVKKQIVKLADSIVEAYNSNADDKWKWFEETMTYANAKLPLSLLLAYRVVKDEKYKEVGVESLEFLKSVTISNNRFVPIGNKGWYRKGGKRAIYDQQPIEAYCMTEMLLHAYRILGKEEYYRLALICFDWFLGRNLKGEMLYDPVTGGCFDGLLPSGVNRNQGAESTISYLLARLEIESMSIE